MHLSGWGIGQVIIETDEIVALGSLPFYCRGHHHAEDVEIDLCTVAVGIHHFDGREHAVIKARFPGDWGNNRHTTGVAQGIRAGLDKKVVLAVVGKRCDVAEGVGVTLRQVKVLGGIILKTCSAGCDPILILKWLRCYWITGKQLITLVIAADRIVVDLLFQR